MQPQHQLTPHAGARSVSQSPPVWQRASAQAITDPAELLRVLDLPSDLLPGAARAGDLFRLRVPRGYVARMRVGDPHDPLLRQILPLDAEYRDPAGFTEDAVGDLDARAGDGLLHKYHGRALLIATGACSVHCRYCFRRHFPYSDETASRGRWRAALDRIRSDESLREVIVSGGDPLSLSDNRLAELADALDAIPHLQRLRIHTRQPVVLPERVDDRLLAWLTRGRLRRIIVIHANHPNELDDATRATLKRLADAGLTVLNQAVLLRGVNDNAKVQVDLSERLFDARVMPYYLHLLDEVRGTAHFEVPETRAIAIWQAAARSLPGYLLPRLARERAGEASKTIIGMDTDSRTAV